MAYTTIKKPSDYFNTVTYSGSETSQTITGVNFSADMAWFKNRTGTAAGGNIYDTVRGISDGWLYTNETAASDNSGQPQITLNSDGYVLNTGYDIINDGASTYVSWNWKANGAGSANTDGSISSTVSANTTSGFSIVSFTGTGANATVGHGLGVAPSMILFKNYSSVNNWLVYNKNLGATKFLYLNVTDAEGTDTGHFNNTEPTSSVFTVGTANGTNKNTENIIAYCFAEKTGYSKFGSYTGNGNADGTFVYTGFKPAFVIAKNTGVSANWVMFDNKRSGFNVDNDEMSPNTSGGDNDGQTYQYIDLLSNGFKWREASNNKNTSGDNFIYMAFAEEPLVGDNPATAR